MFISFLCFAILVLILVLYIILLVVIGDEAVKMGRSRALFTLFTIFFTPIISIPLLILIGGNRR